MKKKGNLDLNEYEILQAVDKGDRAKQEFQIASALILMFYRIRYISDSLTIMQGFIQTVKEDSQKRIAGFFEL